jgi:lipopolysaccharide biosynthesis glycosyltransferase
MLAFSEGPPPIHRYAMDEDPSCAVVHFGGSPKPWRRWLLRNMEYFDETVGLLEWAEAKGWLLPATPWFLQRKYKTFCRLDAMSFEVRRRLWLSMRRFIKKNYY